MAVYRIQQTPAPNPHPLSPDQARAFVRECYDTTFLDEVCRRYGLPVVRLLRQQSEDSDLARLHEDHQRISYSSSVRATGACIHLYIKDYSLRSILERETRSLPPKQPPSALCHLVRALAHFQPAEYVVNALTPYTFFGVILSRFALTGDLHQSFLENTLQRLPPRFQEEIIFYRLDAQGLRLVVNGSYENHHKWLARFGDVYELTAQLSWGYSLQQGELYLYDEFGEVEFTTAKPGTPYEVFTKLKEEICNQARIRKLKLLNLLIQDDVDQE